MTVYHGPNTITHFNEFSLDAIASEIKQNAPALFQLFQSLSHNITTDSSESGSQGAGMSSNDDTKAVTALCVILKRRSVKVLGLQLLIGMMLVGRATSRRVRQITNRPAVHSCVHVHIQIQQAITVLNHAGISVSYTTAWKYLRELVSQSHYQDLVRSGRWQWVFDNVNLHQTVRHERQGKQKT